MNMKYIIYTLFLVILSCSAQNNNDNHKNADLKINESTSVQFFTTPDIQGHKVIIDAIHNAKASIKLWMFNLTDAAVVKELIAARQRGLDIRIILNKDMFSNIDAVSTVDLSKKGLSSAETVYALKAADLTVYKSSDAFSISHAKTMIVDDTYAWITTMNLTMNFKVQRDAGLKIEDPLVISDLLKLFSDDILNAGDHGARTTAPVSPNLVISPTTSEAKLLEFIDSAQTSIQVTVENFSRGAMSEHLIAAAQKGIQVKVIAPGCDLTPNPAFNFPVLALMEKSGVQSRVLVSPASATIPYMHQKMMIVDGKSSFVGSENYSLNSLTKAREIGIILSSVPTAQFLSSTFNADWQQAVDVQKATPDKNCKTF